MVMQPESHIKKLMAAAATYPGTSAECERGFSVGLMNEIAWDKRNSLHVEMVSTLMFLALNGPPLEKFDPLPHVRSWLEKGHRKSTHGCLGHRVPVILTNIMTLLDVCCLAFNKVIMLVDFL